MDLRRPVKGKRILIADYQKEKVIMMNFQTSLCVRRGKIIPAG
jgi:hypothetical protein